MYHLTALTDRLGKETLRLSTGGRGTEAPRFLATGVLEFEVEYLTERTNFPVVMPGHASPSGPRSRRDRPVSLKSGRPLPTTSNGSAWSPAAVVSIVRYEIVARRFNDAGPKPPGNFFISQLISF
jgi:hypothetical protein